MHVTKYLSTDGGAWDEWGDKATGEKLKSCTTIMSEQNDFVAEMHDRVPFILERDDFASWPNEGGTALLKPAAHDVLQRWPH